MTAHLIMTSMKHGKSHVVLVQITRVNWSCDAEVAMDWSESQAVTFRHAFEHNNHAISRTTFVEAEMKLIANNKYRKENKKAAVVDSILPVDDRSREMRVSAHLRSTEHILERERERMNMEETDRAVSNTKSSLPMKK